MLYQLIKQLPLDHEREAEYLRAVITNMNLVSVSPSALEKLYQESVAFGDLAQKLINDLLDVGKRHCCHLFDRKAFLRLSQNL